MNNSKFVNVFQGTGKSSIPAEGTLYKQWNLLKGKAGNVSPAACLPFGCVACSPYSGGYSSGYGNFVPSGSAYPSNFFEGEKIIGFSHFAHSGCGAFGFYYNYLVVAPYLNDFKNSQGLKSFDEEKATPGYYSCRLTEENIRCEVTVSNKVALHRYRSLNGEALKLSIDVSNNGLRQENKRLYSHSTESEMKLYGNGKAGGFVIMQGVKIYFYLSCGDTTAKEKLWIDGEAVADSALYLEQTERRFGILLETNTPSAELKIGFSLVSEENAQKELEATPAFDKTVKAANKKWAEKFNAIQLYGVSDQTREIFYSNFYHTLVKPCGWEKESFLWDEKETFYLDFATMWDVYKTQLPLIFTLYPEVGKGIVKTLLNFGKTQGQLFNALMLTVDTDVGCGTQACCLGCYLLYDAYVRGLVEEAETDDMFAVVKAEMEQQREAILNGTYEKTTKLLDATLIAGTYAELAQTLGRTEDKAYFDEIASYWTEAFAEDGLLKSEYPYYEGNRWNYSFRFVRDAEKRIELAGGKENVLKQLDAFFGFTEENEKLDRFEGFNNESDMEAPYFYHYVGEYDRLAEIVQECTQNCFKRGREGLPGNNDSGGLSSCYLWNYLGLFPISGQDIFFLGVPQCKKAVLQLSNGKKLIIVSKGKGNEVEKVVFDREEITGYSIPVKRIMQGGKLVYYKK